MWDAKFKECVGWIQMKSLIFLNTRLMYPVMNMNKIGLVVWFPFNEFVFHIIYYVDLSLLLQYYNMDQFYE